MAIQSAARTAGKPMITESEIVSPPPRTWMAAATSSGPSCRHTNQATTAICPTNIAAKTNSPHRAVPQNFQILGWRSAGMTAMGAAGSTVLSSESIKRPSIDVSDLWSSCPALCRVSTPYYLGDEDVDGRDKPGHDELNIGRASRQRPLQQTPDIGAREIDGAVHAGVIPGKTRCCEQFRLMRRHLVQGGGCSEQRQPLDCEPRQALRVRPAKCLADERRRVGGAGQSRGFLDKVLQNGRCRLRLARQRPQHVEAHHVSRPFPDRIDRRLAEVPCQNALLHIAVAAEALHRLVEKSRRALADPVFYGRRQQPHEGGFARIVRREAAF